MLVMQDGKLQRSMGVDEEDEAGRYNVVARKWQKNQVAVESLTSYKGARIK
jgi:hypothetical protein